MTQSKGKGHAQNGHSPIDVSTNSKTYILGSEIAPITITRSEGKTHANIGGFSVVLNDEYSLHYLELLMQENPQVPIADVIARKLYCKGNNESLEVSKANALIHWLNRGENIWHWLIFAWVRTEENRYKRRLIELLSFLWEQPSCKEYIPVIGLVDNGNSILHKMACNRDIDEITVFYVLRILEICLGEGKKEKGEDKEEDKEEEFKKFLNGVSHEGETALTLACKNGSKAVVELLLFNGAIDHINAQDYEGKTALMYACERRYWKTVKVLLNSGVDVGVGAIDHKGKTALIYACEKGGWEVVRTFLNIYAQYYENYKKLSEKEAQEFLNRVSYEVGIALMYAYKNGHWNTVEKLLKYSVDYRIAINVDARDERGNTALTLACEKGHWETIDKLLGAGASASDLINAQDYKGNTALIYACKNGHWNTVAELLEVGAECNIDVNARDERGKTALMYACENGGWEVVETFLNIYAQYYENYKKLSEKEAQEFLNRVSYEVGIALMYACENGHWEIVQKLRSIGAVYRNKEALVRGVAHTVKQNSNNGKMPDDLLAALQSLSVSSGDIWEIKKLFVLPPQNAMNILLSNGRYTLSFSDVTITVSRKSQESFVVSIGGEEKELPFHSIWCIFLLQQWESKYHRPIVNDLVDSIFRGITDDKVKSLIFDRVAHNSIWEQLQLAVDSLESRLICEQQLAVDSLESRPSLEQGILRQCLEEITKYVFPEQNKEADRGVPVQPNLPVSPLPTMVPQAGYVLTPNGWVPQAGYVLTPNGWVPQAGYVLTPNGWVPQAGYVLTPSHSHDNQPSRYDGVPGVASDFLNVPGYGNTPMML
jgi:ankyrin repeat protein